MFIPSSSVPSLSIPSVLVTPPYLVPSNVPVPEAVPILGRHALLVPDHERAWIETFQFSSDPWAHQPDFLDEDIDLDMSERKVWDMLKRYRLNLDVHLLVSSRDDIVLNPPLGYCTVYQDQIKTGV